MAIQQMYLDPNAMSYTDDQIVGKINSASAQITRASSVAAAARPIADGEVVEAKLGAAAVSSGKLATGVAKANLDAMTDTSRGYIKTAPTTSEFRVISIERGSDGKAKFDYDDVAI